MKKKAWIGGGIAGGVLLILGILAYFIFSVSPIQESYTYELGESVSMEKADYLSGVSWAVDMWDFDFSVVREHETGEYTVTAVRWFQTCTFQIVIQDTTAPVIMVKEGPLYFEVGTKIQAEEVVKSFSDEDSETKISFLNGAQKTGSFRSETMGEENLTVCAWDSSGNETCVEIQIILDTAPEFTGIQDFYLASGNETDYLAGVTANDIVDGDVSSLITVDTQTLDTDTIGEYEIVYQVTDSYGLIEEQSVTAYVMEPLDLQAAINTHQINRNEQKIVGALNLYDGGYYEADDVKFIQEEMTPSFVQIRFDGADGSWSHGSGFIITMDEERIVLCTNQHVVGKKEKWDVYFFDGTKTEGTVLGTNKKHDVAFVQVSTADLPIETLNRLKTVHINKGYWDSLENEEPIALCLRSIDNEGGVWKERDGKMLQKLVPAGRFPEFSMTDRDLLTTLQQFQGCSGSAILDGHGNLIGMSYCTLRYSDRGTFQMAVNLQEILDDYEEIVGGKAYYE